MPCVELSFFLFQIHNRRTLKIEKNLYKLSRSIKMKTKVRNSGEKNQISIAVIAAVIWCCIRLL